MNVLSLTPQIFILEEYDLENLLLVAKHLLRDLAKLGIWDDRLKNKLDGF